MKCEGNFTVNAECKTIYVYKKKNADSMDYDIYCCYAVAITSVATVFPNS